VQDNTNSHLIINPITPINNTMNMQPSDFTTISYRLDGVEKQLNMLQGQLHQYVPVRENELQLRGIQDSVRRIEDDVAEIRKQISDMTQKMISQESEAQKRDNAQRESQDKLQIRVLYGVVSIVISVLVALLIAYLTHLIQ